MGHWIRNAFFYHVYALGYCDAPSHSDGQPAPGGEPRLRELTRRLDSLASLGVNALLVGPLWQSSSHGYDTIDYRRLDGRLGSGGELKKLVAEAKDRGMRVLLDAAFNHVGREHPWFKDLRERREASPYASWFAGVDFSRPGEQGDGFSYQGWNGHRSLAKLELREPGLRRELIGIALDWIREYGIAGLRMDAADVMDRTFLAELSAACKAEDPDFWLMGEMVHGDYRELTGTGGIDSATNYECYKGLWSSLKDKNYFEIAWSLNRQFGEQGIYRDIRLYNFADNHDVDRAATSLGDKRLLYPLYALLFAMPGSPSVYYGSELGALGARSPQSDRELRPSIAALEAAPPEPALRDAIARFAKARLDSAALRDGAYSQLWVSHQGFAFERRLEPAAGPRPGFGASGGQGAGSAPSAGSAVIVCLNASDSPMDFALGAEPGQYADLLDPAFRIGSQGRSINPRVPPFWTRWLVRRG